MVIFVRLFLCDYIHDKDYKTLKKAFVAICYIKTRILTGLVSQCLPYNSYPNFDGSSFVGDSFPLITTNKHYLKHNGVLVFLILMNIHFVNN